MRGVRLQLLYDKDLKNMEKIIKIIISQFKYLSTEFDGKLFLFPDVVFQEV